MFLADPRRLAHLLLVAVSCPLPSQGLKIPNTPEKLHLAQAPSDRFPAKWYTRAGDGTDVVPAPVEDHPFTATSGGIMPVAAETSGQQSSGFEARDRYGRTRNEAENGGYAVADQSVKTKSVLVSDPVSHCDFQWTQPVTNVEMPPEMRVAMVTCRPLTLRYKELDLVSIVLEAVPDGVKRNGDTTTKTEHLAPVTIDGLSIKRLRVTNSSADGQGQIKTWVTETWYSTELREIIRSGSEENGYTGLTNIQLRDPDPALFYPPEGFRIELRDARR